MTTRVEAAQADSVAPPPVMATGIVRSADAFWAAAAAIVVVIAHAATVPLDAWLPVDVDGTAVGAAFLTPMSPGAAWIVRTHAALAAVSSGVAWPARLAWTSLVLTAIATFLMSRAFGRVGLPGVTAALLALVAAGGPLLWGQATTALGGAVITTGSSFVVVATTRALRLGWRTVGLLSIVTAASWLAWWPAGAGALRGVATELGGVGLLLVGTALATAVNRSQSSRGRTLRPDGRRQTLRIVAVGVAVWSLAMSLGPVAQVAAAVPFAWALVAVGLTTIMAWHERPGRSPSRLAGAWLVVGLVAWTGVQAFGRPWSARHELTVLAAQWARATASAAGPEAPLVTDATPASVLVEAWARDTPGFAQHLSLAQLHSLTPGVRALTVLPWLAERSAWMGLAPESQPASLTSLAAVLDMLPPGVIAVVAVSSEASTTLGPDDWQALIATGSRAGPGGLPRARAVVGLSATRAAGQESVGSTQATVGLLLGDEIGRTGHRSPLDLRVDAGTRDVLLVERDRPRAMAPGVIVAVYRRTGVLLGIWTGSDAKALGAGVPGSAGSPVGRVREVLACRDVAADAPVDVADLALDGALGIQAPPRSQLLVTSTWLDGRPSAVPALVDDGEAHTDGSGALDISIDEGGPVGVSLRGRPAAVHVRADSPVRVCQAPPVQRLTSLAIGQEVDVHPRIEPSFGGGWHGMEPMGAGRYFRWMSGARAVILLAVSPGDAPTSDVRLTLDAQSVGQPGPNDRLRLLVNGTSVEPLALASGRAPYTWSLPRSLLREGLNELLLDTTLTLRPADLQAGADGRLLGLAVYGWRVGCEAC